MLHQYAAAKSGLVAVLHTMWTQCVVRTQLLRAELRVLSSLTAHSSEGLHCTIHLPLYVISLSSFPGLTAIATCARQGSTFMHDIIKMATHSLSSYQSCSAAKRTSPHHAVLLDLFPLLANTALSPECRGIMRKVGIKDQSIRKKTIL